MDPLRAQYEKFPYPPVPSMALPVPGQGRELSYEFGSNLPHEGIRILVAGAGTLEPVVVAQAHPRAREVVAVDFSRRSIAILKRRLALARIRAFMGFGIGAGPLPPVRPVAADLGEWEDGTFDYIIASNVLHHMSDPAAMLRRLASWLRPGAIMRIVTYPKSSRIWMREISKQLKRCPPTFGICTASTLKKQCMKTLLATTQDNAVHIPKVGGHLFDIHPETGTRAGIKDAFFNERENPLSPLQWAAACHAAGLELFSEGQDEGSRSDFLDFLLPRAATLDRWSKLQVLDDLLELCTNPVLWLRKPDVLSRERTDKPKLESEPEPIPTHAPPPPLPKITLATGKITDYTAELALYLHRADAILNTKGLGVRDAIAALRKKVGPRTSAPPEERVLSGLSMIDYDIDQLLAAHPQALPQA